MGNGGGTFMADTTDSLRERLTAALEADDVPKLYVNGFVNSLSTGDITTLLERNGKPVAILNISFTVAKTLSIALGNIVAQIEERAGRSMLTTHELAKLLEDSDQATDGERDGQT
jgi:hypothetical protein